MDPSDDHGGPATAPPPARPSLASPSLAPPPLPRRGRPLAALAAGTAVLILAIALMNALVLGHLRESALAAAEERLGRRSAALAEQADQALKSIDLILAEVAEHVADRDITTPDDFRRRLGTEATHRLLGRKLAGLPQLRALSLAGVDGDLVVSSRMWPNPPLNLADRGYFRQMKARGGAAVFVGAPVQSRFDASWIFGLHRRIEAPDGSLIGIASGIVSLDYFETFYRALAASAADTFALLRRDGVLLVRHPAVSLLGDTDPIPIDAPTAARGRGPLDGADRLWAVRPLRTHPLAMVASTTTEQALADWRSIARLSLVLSALAALVVTGAAVALGLWWRARTGAEEARLARAEAERALAAATGREQATRRLGPGRESRPPLPALHDIAAALLGGDLRPEETAALPVQMPSAQAPGEQVPFAPDALVEEVLAAVRRRGVAACVALRGELEAAVPPVLIGEPAILRDALKELLATAVAVTTRGEVRLGVRCLSRIGETAAIEWSIRSTAAAAAAVAAWRIVRPPAADRGAGDPAPTSPRGELPDLAGCRAAIARMGGEIDLSPPDGEGFAIRIRLALGWADAAPLAQRAERAAAAALQARLAARDRPLRVLIAEDNPTGQLVLVRMLAEFALVPRLVADGAGAVEATAHFPFDLVLMDVRMPDLDGLAATRAIRARGGDHATMPIIGVTAAATPEDVAACRAAGMTAVVGKPVRKQTLVEAVHAALADDPAEAFAATALAAPSAEIVAQDRATIALLVEEIGEEGTRLAVDLFVGDTEARLARLRALSPTRERRTVMREAHTLKGAAGTLGLRGLAALARELEWAAGTITPAEYLALLDRLDAGYARARRSLADAIAAIRTAA
ncbi:Signal transduction histidine kinase [Rhodovulum sp. PH10]|uniref:response regulator n=1 Tax=Rhodovulum sp. PH10 TaxID=1187851 RepID=UPI00027C1DCF|nr:response regulator [Rhodovulum sp. PH10]EJW12906.1 Signal transduction histidine kinase [Rhodovulum sp. PH10]